VQPCWVQINLPLIFPALKIVRCLKLTARFESARRGSTAIFNFTHVVNFTHVIPFDRFPSQLWQSKLMVSTLPNLVLRLYAAFVTVSVPELCATSLQLGTLVTALLSANFCMLMKAPLAFGLQIPHSSVTPRDRRGVIGLREFALYILVHLR
jgi:hypothetical protein